MELRKDPITRSWVIVGHREDTCETSGGCPFCPRQDRFQARPAAASPARALASRGSAPSGSALPRRRRSGRRADGMYDTMQPVGADEIVIETPRARPETRRLERRPDPAGDGGLEAAHRGPEARPPVQVRLRLQELRRLAGQEGSHAHSQSHRNHVCARRILYELRAAREWYAEKERCVFCDIVKQEERQGKRIVDTQGDYVALCPYASRVPYEVWLLNRKHNHLFEQPLPDSNRRHLAALLRRVLRRIRQVAPAYHLVVHTSPNTIHPKGETSAATGKPLRTIITGTSKSCPSSKREASPTASRKSITTHSCRKKRPNGCASWTPTREAARTRRHFLSSACFCSFSLAFLAFLYVVRHPLMRLAGRVLDGERSRGASRRASSFWAMTTTPVIAPFTLRNCIERAWLRWWWPAAACCAPYVGIAEMMEHDLESLRRPGGIDREIFAPRRKHAGRSGSACRADRAAAAGNAF